MHLLLAIGADRAHALDGHQHVLAQSLMDRLDPATELLHRPGKEAEAGRYDHRSGNSDDGDPDRECKEERYEEKNRTGADDNTGKAAVGTGNQPCLGPQHVHEIRLIMASKEGIRS